MKGPGLHSRTATRADDVILQNFSRENPTEGSVNFCLLREPGFFSALEVEGSHNDVALVSENEKLVGMGLRSEKEVYINGEKGKMGYYSGVRILKKHQGNQVLFRIARMARELHEKSDCRIYLANIFTDNIKAIDTFFSLRRTNPAVRFIGNYKTFVFRPDRLNPAGVKNNGLMISKFCQQDTKDLILFINNYGKSRQYFPVYTVDHLTMNGGLLKGLQADRIFLARHNKRIVGSMALWDQNSFRQWMVKNYSGMLNYLRPVINMMASLRNRPGFPPPGAAINYKIISLCCIDDNFTEAFNLLLNEILHEIKNERSLYVAIGFHESDPLLPLFKYPAVSLGSRLYITYWPEDSQFAEQIDNRLPYFELGSL